jgi:hypothetical protein
MKMTTRCSVDVCGDALAQITAGTGGGPVAHGAVPGHAVRPAGSDLPTAVTGVGRSKTVGRQAHFRPVTRDFLSTLRRIRVLGTEKVLLADLDAIVTKDGVGGGDVKMNVRQHVIH